MGLHPILVFKETYSTFPLGAMQPQKCLGMESDWETLASSPMSEAVTHDMEAISLQPSYSLPSIQERKNGEQINVASLLKLRITLISIIFASSSTLY